MNACPPTWGEGARLKSSGANPARIEHQRTWLNLSYLVYLFCGRRNVKWSRSELAGSNDSVPLPGDSAPPRGGRPIGCHRRSRSSRWPPNPKHPPSSPESTGRRGLKGSDGCWASDENPRDGRERMIAPIGGVSRDAALVADYLHDGGARRQARNAHPVLRSNEKIVIQDDGELRYTRDAGAAPFRYCTISRIVVSTRQPARNSDTVGG
jgi:hypothetical protein